MLVFNIILYKVLHFCHKNPVRNDVCVKYVESVRFGFIYASFLSSNTLHTTTRSVFAWLWPNPNWKRTHSAVKSPRFHWLNGQIERNSIFENRQTTSKVLCLHFSAELKGKSRHVASFFSVCWTNFFRGGKLLVLVTCSEGILSGAHTKE